MLETGLPFDWRDHIVHDPRICGGRDGIVAAYPSLNPDHVKAAIAFAVDVT